MASIRAYHSDDLDALYSICLLTGASGQDATDDHHDPSLLGHIYAAPYGVLEPQNVLIVEDEDGVAGYVVGTHDSRAFEARLEAEWWPRLRKQYADTDDMTVMDRRMIAMIEKPSSAPAEYVGPYPAHIHMNLLPRLRGQRIGSRLLEQWTKQARAAGVKGIHLAASSTNAGGIAFWGKNFDVLRRDDGAVWFGKTL